MQWAEQAAGQLESSCNAFNPKSILCEDPRSRPCTESTALNFSLLHSVSVSQSSLAPNMTSLPQASDGLLQNKVKALLHTSFASSPHLLLSISAFPQRQFSSLCFALTPHAQVLRGGQSSGSQQAELLREDAHRTHSQDVVMRTDARALGEGVCHLGHLHHDPGALVSSGQQVWRSGSGGSGTCQQVEETGMEAQKAEIPTPTASSLMAA